MSKETILMTENQWANSQFSIAKYYGGIRINGKNYMICNKYGITLVELSNPDSKYYVGDNNMAIPPGEPADLILEEWIPIYKKLGRDRFIEIIETGVSLEEAKGIAGLKRKLNKEN